MRQRFLPQAAVSGAKTHLSGQLYCTAALPHHGTQQLHIFFLRVTHGGEGFWILAVAGTLFWLCGALMGYRVGFALAAGDLLTGALVVEKIYGINGIGKLMVDAIAGEGVDYNYVLALGILYSSLYIGMMLAVDILYGILDPRIRVSAKGEA